MQTKVNSDLQKSNRLQFLEQFNLNKIVWLIKLILLVAFLLRIFFKMYFIQLYNSKTNILIMHTVHAYCLHDKLRYDDYLPFSSILFSSIYSFYLIVIHILFIICFVINLELNNTWMFLYSYLITIEMQIITTFCRPN